jgi:hypothetical protein
MGGVADSFRLRVCMTVGEVLWGISRIDPESTTVAVPQRPDPIVENAWDGYTGSSFRKSMSFLRSKLSCYEESLTPGSVALRNMSAPSVCVEVEASKWMRSRKSTDKSAVST